MGDNTTTALPKSFPMNSGNGTYSYSQNSSYQREASTIVMALIAEAIAEKLDIENFHLKSFQVADLSCSVGPNTYIGVQNLLEAVEKTYKSKGLDSSLPEFQVFFNDHATNDFNTLFTTLPLEKQYFVAGVPGSFHGRLFPESSLHIVHASYALHWLSKVPKEVENQDSPAWNSGRIYYTSAAEEVANSYAAQFSKDMDNFLNARAKEIVVGGMMLLVMAAVEDGTHPSQTASGLIFDALGSCLMDMAREGLISEAEVDSFNLPMYITTPKEMAGLIERNMCFTIERIKITDPLLKVDEQQSPADMRVWAMHVRAAIEGILAEHFGGEIIDEVFGRLYQKVEGFSQIPSSHKNGNHLFLALKRK